MTMGCSSSRLVWIVHCKLPDSGFESGINLLCEICFLTKSPLDRTSELWPVPGLNNPTEQQQQQQNNHNSIPSQPSTNNFRLTTKQHHVGFGFLWRMTIDVDIPTPPPDIQWHARTRARTQRGGGVEEGRDRQTDRHLLQLVNAKPLIDDYRYYRYN